MEIRKQNLVFSEILLHFSSKLHIIKVTEPDTPLSDAYHVGSFNFWGEIGRGEQSAAVTDDGGRSGGKPSKSWIDY